MNNTMSTDSLIIEHWSSQPSSRLTANMIRGVKVTHVPSGISVTCDSERSQHANRAIALRELNEKLENRLHVSPADFSGISANLGELKKQHAFMLALIKDLKAWDINQWGHVRGLAVPAELRARMQEAIDEAHGKGGDV